MFYQTTVWWDTASSIFPSWAPWITPVFLLIPLSVSRFQYFLLVSILISSALCLRFPLKPDFLHVQVLDSDVICSDPTLGKGRKSKQCLPRNGCLCRNCLQPAPLLWECRMESRQWLFFMSVATELATYCENRNPLESFWQKYQTCHCNQIPLWMVTCLPECPGCSLILVNVCGEWFPSIMQDSVHPGNAIASDWKALGCEGLLV